MKKILIVEDNVLVRENVVELLTFEGYHVLAADNGCKGLQLAQAELPDLIISDMMMPKLDGFGLFELLRQKPPTAAIPFIFLTARAEQVLIDQAVALGARHYLTKPFTTVELLTAIQGVLD
jgi:two-component system, sensor histidine kinase and response regulator